MTMRKARVLGLLAALLAEVASIGLLSASGWFITASAIAGLTMGSTFSYIFPSGWVRAFAIGRIALQYAQRLLLHRTALEEVGTERTRYFSRVAQAPERRLPRSGDALDRAMHDTETVGMRVIRVTAPVWTYWGVFLIAAVGLAVVAPFAAVGVAAFGGAAWVLAGWRDRVVARGITEVAAVRASLRDNLIEVAQAWPELVSLGAAARVGNETMKGLRGFEQLRLRRALAAEAGASWLSGLGVVAASIIVSVAVLADRVDTPLVMLVALMSVGLAGTTATLPALLSARREDRAARERLMREGELTLRDDPAIDLSVEPNALLIRRYVRPADATHARLELSAQLSEGQVLALVGPSGSGKTTLLVTLAHALERAGSAPGAVIEVPLDDAVFTGTVAENLRIADAEATDAQLELVLEGLGLGNLPLSTSLGVGGRALSGGELNRMRLARALLANPRVLLVDEPLIGLDAATARQALEAMASRRSDGMLIIAVHDVEPVRATFGSDRTREVRLDGASGRG